MVAYARVRAKSWLSILWPDMAKSSQPEEITDKQSEQNKRFLELTKKGGMWFS